MDEPNVSIIMGTYNPNCRYLFAALRSIINQTYQSWELIMIDDGSDYDISAQISNFAYIDKRICFIRQRSNAGLGRTLNHAIKLSRGKYIARMDDDDISLPERLDAQVKFLDKNPQYAWTGCTADLFDETGVWGRADRPKEPDAYAFLHSSPFIHPSVMFRRQVLVDYGYSERRIEYRCEDYELFMRLYAKGYRGYNSQKILFQYREDEKRLKRPLIDCVHEVQVRARGFSQMGILSFRTTPYVLKPLAVGAMAAFPQTAQRIRLKRNIRDHRIGEE